MSESPKRERTKRRHVLRTVGVSASLLLAGCLDNDGETETEQADADEESDSNRADEDDTEQEPNGGTEQLPTSGGPVEGLEPLEEVVREYMAESDIGAGALAVHSDGELVLERGFGWVSPDRTEPVKPDAVYRIGSLSKQFTDDAIGRLVEAGDLALDDPVFPLLEVEPPDGELADDRFEAVTVRHLLNHQGGWDRFQHANPLFDPLVVVDALGLDRPPERDDFLRWMLDTPLQFAPGTQTVYSNLGYVLLGHVIESVTGQTYQSYIEETLLADAPSVELGETRPEHRHPDEVWYDDREQCPNVFDSGEGSCADVGMVVSAFEAAGGHVARPRDLIVAREAIDHVWIDPTLGEDIGWREGPPEGPYLGSLFGSYAYAARPQDDTHVVALFNGRHRNPEIQQSIAFEMAEAYQEVSWP